MPVVTVPLFLIVFLTESGLSRGGDPGLEGGGMGGATTARAAVAVEMAAVEMSPATDSTSSMW